MQAKSSILVGGVSWLNVYKSFVVEQEDLGLNPAYNKGGGVWKKGEDYPPIV